MSAAADRNLLFGILAVQMDFIGKDALVEAMNAWVLDKAKPLGQILRERQALSADEHDLLDALVQKHLAKHNNDPQQSLAALSSLDDSARRALAAVPDNDVQGTLMQVGVARPKTSVPPTPATEENVTAMQPPPPPHFAGRFRILRLHAKGGLGEVYVAEDTELGRPVALKEIQASHADRPDSRTRFMLEAEITGGLEHPGIVPVYGLGSYADGRPFYAMRFIKGDNLREAIRQFHGSVGATRFESVAFRQLLGRFVDVCNAVAYAHSRGVLHRDLKPGNIMLGKYGETLVVDWGLAKVAGPAGAASDRADDEPTLQPRSSSAVTATMIGRALGTPGYMSPEQADGLIDDLGPASDVYSLGATLYELLAGQAPFATAPAEVMLADVRAGRFAPLRQVEPRAPRPLEAVCRHAMSLRPTDRYPSAQVLAADIERWLADEPVSAHRESSAAKTRRWVRKHARLVTGIAATLVVGIVSLGIGAILLAAANERERAAKQRAQVARREAESAQQSEQVARQKAESAQQRELVARQEAESAQRQAMTALRTTTDDVVQQLIGEKPAFSATEREFLTTTLRRWQEFAAQKGEGELARAIRAEGTHRVARLRGMLGDQAAAVAGYQEAVALREKLTANFPTVRAYRSDLADTLGRLGYALQRLARPTEAEAALRAALAEQKKLAIEFPDEPAFRSAVANSQNNLGAVLYLVGKQTGAEAEYRAALAEQKKLVAEFPDQPEYASALARTHNNFGAQLRIQRKWAVAEAEFRADLAEQQKLTAQFPAVPVHRIDLANSRNNLGALLADMGKRTEAVAEYRAARAEQARLVSEFPALPSHRDGLSATCDNLGNVLVELGQLAEAEVAYRDALVLRQKLADDSPEQPQYRVNLAITRMHLGNVLSQLDKRAEAEAEFRAAVAVQDKLAADFPMEARYRNASVRTQFDFARWFVQSGEPAKAVAAIESVLPRLTQANDVYNAACVFSVVFAKTTDDAAAAERHAVRAVALLRQAIGNGFGNIPQLLKDASLNPLRQRADFADLLWEIADSPGPPMGAKP